MDDTAINDGSIFDPFSAGQADAPDQHQIPRKRKLDKDGFVCPTTPDIPKSSSQFMDKRNHDSFNGVGSLSNLLDYDGECGEQTSTDKVSCYFRPIKDEQYFQTSEENTDYQSEEQKPAFQTKGDDLLYETGADNLSYRSDATNSPSQIGEGNPIGLTGTGNAAFQITEDNEPCISGADNSSYKETGNEQNQMVENNLLNQPATDTSSYLTAIDNPPYRLEEDNPMYQTLGDNSCYQLATDDPSYVTGKAQPSYHTRDIDLPNEEGAAAPGHADDLVHSLLKGVQQESAMMFDQWIEILRKSSHYEMMCPQKLDNMIQEAKSIEDTLKNKKDVLCSRLQGIGKTLEM